MLYRTCLKQGRKPAAVFLHGFLGRAEDWSETVSHLERTALAFDLPGHGRTPYRPDFCSLLATAIAGMGPVHCVGYSLGGRLALLFASRFPDQVASLTLISAHLGLQSGEERKQRAVRDEKWAAKLHSLSIDEFLREWYDQSLFSTLVSRGKIPNARRIQNREGLAEALVEYSLARQPDLTSFAAQRARLVVGEKDAAFRRCYQGLPHNVIPGAGHAVHLEEPKQLAELLGRIWHEHEHNS